MTDDPPKDRNGVERVLARNAKPGGKRSPLYRWMRKHHDRLIAEFDEHGTNWRELVKGFAEIGLTDRNGRPPTLRGAQQTWYRVRRDVAADRARKSRDPQQAVRVTPVVRSSPTPPPAEPPPPADSAGASDQIARLVAEANQRSGRKPNG